MQKGNSLQPIGLAFVRLKIMVRLGFSTSLVILVNHTSRRQTCVCMDHVRLKITAWLVFKCEPKTYLLTTPHVYIFVYMYTCIPMLASLYKSTLCFPCVHAAHVCMCTVPGPQVFPLCVLRVQSGEMMTRHVQCVHGPC